MKKIVSVILAAAAIFMAAAFSSCGSGTGAGDAAEEAYRLSKDFEVELYAKDASLIDCMLTPYGGAVSGAAVGYMDSRSSSCAWTVEVPAEAYYAVAVRYNCSPLVSYDLFVNETVRVPLGFEGDNTFRTSAALVRLKKGENVLKVRNTQGQGYSAVIDTVRVSGLGTPAELTALLGDTEIPEGTAEFPLPAAEGFEIAVVSSSDPSVVAPGGAVTAPENTEEVTVRVCVSRGDAKSECEIAARVMGKTPSAEQTAGEIFARENGKVIEKGRTSLPFPALYEGQEYYIAETSDASLVSRGGVVCARKEDAEVRVKYLVHKADGTSAYTDEITAHL